MCGAGLSTPCRERTYTSSSEDDSVAEPRFQGSPRGADPWRPRLTPASIRSGFWLVLGIVEMCLQIPAGRWVANPLLALPTPCYVLGVVSGGETDDCSLVAAMARGDRLALAALYDLYAPILVALVRRILGSRQEAEDVVHDVFLESWRRAADYDQTRGSVRTWLALRARSRALDRKKSAAVQRTVSSDHGAAIAPAAAEDTSNAPDCARLRRALIALPVEQRTVLLLGYFEGMSSSEIADTVGVPIGTVKSRVAAALARLRAAIAPDASGGDA
jgi:RNA polymerase sigma-70 factor, ECF subfamily